MGPVVLVAPAAFKGTLGPRKVAAALGAGVRLARPDATVLERPISDGGDGLLDAVLAPDARRVELPVAGPLGAPVLGVLGWLDPETAIFESATACGIALLEPRARDPLRTTTRGVGELIRNAIARGARRVIVGLGGSATVDGGTGAARGLGWTVRGCGGVSLPEGGGSLRDLEEFEGRAGLAISVVGLADVTTPLTGPDGAAAVFGPQKGASPAGVRQLAAGLEVLGAAFARHGRPELARLPGGGAAGGLGAGLAFFAAADLVRGATWVLDRVGFDAALASADLVITAEGAFDRTSLVGKATGEVLRRAAVARKRAAVVAGQVVDQGGVHALGGDGRTLDERDIATLAARATSAAFGLPAP
jgi:glycerate kinase